MGPFRVRVLTIPEWADDAKLALIAELLAEHPFANARVERDERGFGEIGFDFEAPTYEDAVEQGHRALRAAVTAAGIDLSWFHSPWDSRTRARATRNASAHIRFYAREIVHRGAEPITALERITRTARMTVPPYTPYRWPEAPIWPLYRRFFDIATRWEAAATAGKVSVKLRMELAAEVVAAAKSLLPDRD